MTVAHDVHIPQRTIGVSPKVISTVLVGLVGYALTKLAVPFDPAVEQALNIVAMALAGYWAPPGAVPAEDIGPASDALIGDLAHLHRASGEPDPPAAA